ncbi:putative iron-regulated membrane protein [Pseudomonas sp. EB276 TE3739]
MRAFLVLLHRYIGLATAVFLLLAGLTGSVLAFNHELDEWLNPQFYEATSVGERLPTRCFSGCGADCTSETADLVHGVSA